ncbi:MAG: hypothetical protein J6N45_02850 [Alphaproteobacteria bacterium]|nr:hypothetical protein [Alphaproteobacteria bacterium]
MKKIFKYLLLSLVMVAFSASKTFALNELDIPELGAAASFEIEQLLKQIETQYGTNLHISDEKHQQGEGNEGKHLFWEKVKGAGTDYLEKKANEVKDAAIEQVKSGNFNIKDLANNIATGAMPDLSAFSASDLINLGKQKLQAKQEVDKAQEELESIEKAELEERQAKIKEIKSEILKYETAMAPLAEEDPTRTEYGVTIVQLQHQLDDLEANEDTTDVSENGEKQTTTDNDKTQEPKKDSVLTKLNKKKNAIAKKYEDKKAAAMKKIAEAKEKYANITKVLDAGKAFQSLTQKADSMLFGNAESEETEDDVDMGPIYTQTINDFFLAEDEPYSSEGITRIMKKRKQAYYEALQDLLTSATQGDGMTLQTQADAKKMRDSLTETADTNFGAKNMQIGVDFQIVKSSAQLTKMLLAKLKMESLQTIQDWNNFYKLNDYSQDFTLFNLDIYEYDPSLKGKLKTMGKGLLDKAKKGIQNKVTGTVQSAKDTALQKISGAK